MNPVLERLLETGEFTQGGQRYSIAHCTPPEVCQRYAELITGENIRHAIEIGTLFGFSTLFLSEALEQTGGWLDTVDIRRARRTWVDGREVVDIHEVAERLATEAGFGDRITFHGGDSNAVLAKLIGEGRRCEFALIDGGHQFQVTLLDFIGIDRMLEVGGYVAIDDVGARVSAKTGLSGGPNRVLGKVLATNRYEIELWTANIAVCRKLQEPGGSLH